ncbi:MAG: 1,4-alpha-glucan branching protein GlgB [Opitutaceae bacterium]|nr:1,4-alpha-glucan branching protein GlgB [Opitutaceae bacterium]
MIIPEFELKAFLSAQQSNPHAWLGMHPVKKVRSRGGVVVRAFLYGAQRCEVVDMDAPGAPAYPMRLLAAQGFFELLVPKKTKLFRYQLRYATEWGETRQVFDGYCFLPTLSDQDLYLFNEGNEHRIYDKLGAHLRNVGGVPGVTFAVWAPTARQVSLLGNFNGWDARYHPMRPLGSSGVWELFVPGLRKGELYKFAVEGGDGHRRIKTDPYAKFFEAPPNNASIVADTHRHRWGDGAWMEKRRESAGADRPLSIYEVHLGSWRRVPEDASRPLKYREIAPLLADYVLEMGFTHVELLPISEYPFDGSWGYQVTGFFAPTHRFGTPEDFQFMVDHLHQRGIGVILDWVPAHFPRDSFALAEFDGTHLYEHADPRLGAHQDWGTLIFNFGRHEVRCFLIASALAWLDRYHIDGLRVDAVASMLYLDYSRKEGEWIPNQYGGRENLEAIAFLRQVNDLVHHYYPGALMIAEESTSFGGVSKPTRDGGLGFDYKWNMGMMHDTLEYFRRDPLHRKWHHHLLTFGMLYQYSENFVTVYSHDEVVHGKASMLFKMGAAHIPEKAANLRALYGYVWTYPGKKLLFMGGEFGQSAEWNHGASLDWHLRQYRDHEGVRLLVRDLNQLYSSDPVLSAQDFRPGNFRWVNCNDGDNSVISFLRLDEGETKIYLIVGNYTPVLRANYRVGVPRPGYWLEVLNTNAEAYGGSGAGNFGGINTKDLGADGQAQSLDLTLPGLSTLVFLWQASAQGKALQPTEVAVEVAADAAAFLSPSVSA